MPKQEQFNPYDEKYKKATDLPEAIRDKFVDLPEGGFVRKTAHELESKMENKAKKMPRKKLETGIKINGKRHRKT